MDSLRHFFENLAYEWDDAQPPDRKKILCDLIDPFNDMLHSCAMVLEVGTGTGALISILQERCPDARLVSLDLANRMLVKARQRAVGLRLVQGDVHHLPFPAQTFDALICHNAFPHFWWQETALDAFHRTLTPEGHFLILHDISREHVNAVHRYAANPVIHRDLLPKADVLARTLEEAGFTPILVEDRPDRYVIYAKSSG